MVARGAQKGLSVEKKFTTTIHAINSGVVKLSRLQPATKICRGISGLKMPASFMEPNDFNIEAGVECGFMSATLDRRVAEKYSKGKSNEPSIIFEMRMGMVNRGAYLGFVSEYPHECEILIPPLTGLEVLRKSRLADGTLLFEMALNVNLQSKTIEEILAARWSSTVELARWSRPGCGRRRRPRRRTCG